MLKYQFHMIILGNHYCLRANGVSVFFPINRSHTGPATDSGLVLWHFRVGSTVYWDTKFCIVGVAIRLLTFYFNRFVCGLMFKGSGKICCPVLPYIGFGLVIALALVYFFIFIFYFTRVAIFNVLTLLTLQPC